MSPRNVWVIPMCTHQCFWVARSCGPPRWPQQNQFAFVPSVGWVIPIDGFVSCHPFSIFIPHHQGVLTNYLGHNLPAAFLSYIINHAPPLPPLFYSLAVNFPRPIIFPALPFSRPLDLCGWVPAWCFLSPRVHFWPQARGDMSGTLAQMPCNMVTIHFDVFFWTHLFLLVGPPLFPIYNPPPPPTLFLPLKFPPVPMGVALFGPLQYMAVLIFVPGCLFLFSVQPMVVPAWIFWSVWLGWSFPILPGFSPSLQ